MTNVELSAKISGYLKGSKAKAKKIKDLVAIHFNLLDTSEDMYIEIKDGVISVMPYEYNDRTAAVTVSTENIDKIMSGEITIDAAIADGLVKVEGDVESFKALAAVIPAKKDETKKAPAKKATAKTEEKKPAAKKPCAKKAAAPKAEAATAKVEAPKPAAKAEEKKPAAKKPAAKKATK